MKPCCYKTLNEIQHTVENANIAGLMLLLAPWVILLGDTPTDDETAAQLLARLTVEQAISKLGPEAPDELDAARTMSPILRDSLALLAASELLNKVHTPLEGQFWKRYTLRYRREKE